MKLEKLLLSYLIFLITFCLSDSHAYATQIAKQKLVGEYHYTGEEIEDFSSSAKITLGASGKCSVIQKKSKKASQQQNCVWNLEKDRDEVVVNHHGYPIKLAGDTVKLIINDDLPVYWEKQ